MLVFPSCLGVCGSALWESAGGPPPAVAPRGASIGEVGGYFGNHRSGADSWTHIRPPGGDDVDGNDAATGVPLDLNPLAGGDLNMILNLHRSPLVNSVVPISPESPSQFCLLPFEKIVRSRLGN